VAAVYKPRLRVLCEGYDDYLFGLPEALHLLNDLKRRDDRFSSFVALRGDEAAEMTIDDFIAEPLAVRRSSPHVSQPLHCLIFPHSICRSSCRP
jgi:hypothetical protein